jgi:hypothetical protein
VNEDAVTNDFADAIDREVVQYIGIRPVSLPYELAMPDDWDGTWPFVVVRDGREFEVDIEVRVTELTPERKAAREAEAQRVTEMLKRWEARQIEDER